MTFARPVLLAFMAALSTTDLPAATTATTQAGTGTEGAASAVFPQERVIEGFTLIIHAPQVRSWTEFEHFTSTIAFSLTPSGQTTVEYGTATVDRKSTRLNSSHSQISYAVFCLKKKKKNK